MSPPSNGLDLQNQVHSLSGTPSRAHWASDALYWPCRVAVWIVSTSKAAEYRSLLLWGGYPFHTGPEQQPATSQPFD